MKPINKLVIHLRITIFQETCLTVATTSSPTGPRVYEPVFQAKVFYSVGSLFVFEITDDLSCFGLPEELHPKRLRLDHSIVVGEYRGTRVPMVAPEYK